jgi:subtilisin family serine protease
MALFVMSNRRAGKFRGVEKKKSRSALESVMDRLSAQADIIHDTIPRHPSVRRSVIFDAHPKFVKSLKTSLHTDVMVEPEIRHGYDPVLPIDFSMADRSSLARSVDPGGSRLTVRVHSGGKPLYGAEVHLFLQGKSGNDSQELRGLTSANGLFVFDYLKDTVPIVVYVVPSGNFWAMYQKAHQDTVTIECPPLPTSGPIGWWHNIMGVHEYIATRGEGILVGVIDTGIGSHPALRHIEDIGAFSNGKHVSSRGCDIETHGSHVNGIIGSRPTKIGQFAGVAPGCTQFSACVYKPGKDANQADIAAAIDTLSRDYHVDLINLSLGSPSPSEIEHDAIKDALERGTLCVCSAGNTNSMTNKTPLLYPARFKETVAVSGLGLNNWGPQGSLTSWVKPPSDQQDWFGLDNLFLATFSRYGESVRATGPGAGIISTVPERFGLEAPFGADSGTSMSSPLVCGALASLLSCNAQYKNLPRDFTRSAMASEVLKENCYDIGLNKEFQGLGIPHV